jgi:hypothetical protein
VGLKNKCTPAKLVKSRNRESVPLQDIDSFTKVSETTTVLAVKDLTFSAPSAPTPRHPTPDGDLAAASPSPACEINVEKVSVWLPNTSSYILAALAANVADLCQSVGRRSSDVDIIKPSQVIYLPHQPGLVYNSNSPK